MMVGSAMPGYYHASYVHDIVAARRPAAGELAMRSTFRITTALVIAGLFAAKSTPERLQEPEHAPTKDMCRADVAVWWSESVIKEYDDSETELMRTGKYKPNRAGDVPFRELGARAHEMLNCQHVDPEGQKLYSYAFEFYSAVRSDRFERFIQRHELREQFVKEDAQGLR
jgi:hypothetical protein